MSRHQSKEKETDNRGADMTEVNIRAQLLKKRIASSPASLTADLNMTLEDRSCSKALNVTVCNGN